MNAAPFFSVVVPTRDRADQLERALDSVTRQTDQDFEIIVVDDGSDSLEAARIAAIVGKTPKAKLLRNPASIGAPRSRNIGVAKSRGQMIALLDSDDWWAPTRLAAHRAAAGENPLRVMIYNIAELVDAKGGSMGLSNDRAPDPTKAKAVAIAASNVLGGCSSVCVDRASFLAVGGFSPDLPSCQDWDLWFRLAQAGSTIRFVPEVLTHQDCGRHQRISNQRDRVLAGHATVMRKIRSAEWNSADRRYIEAHHQRVRAWIEHSFGDDARAFRFALDALLRLRDQRSGRIAAKYAKRALLS